MPLGKTWLKNTISNIFQGPEIYMIFVNGLFALAGLFFWSVLYRKLPFDIIGSGSNFIAIAILVGYWGRMGIDQGILKAMGKRLYISKFNWMRIFIIIVISILILSNIASFYIEIPVMLVGLTACAIVLNLIIDAILISRNLNKDIAVKGLIVSFGRVIFVLTFNFKDATSILLIWSLPLITAVSIYTLRLVFILSKPHTSSPSALIDLFKYSTIMFISMGIYTVPSQLLPTFIHEGLGSSELGKFASVWMIMQIIFTSAQVFKDTMISDPLNINIQSRLIRSIRLQMLIFIPLVLILWVLTPLIILLITNTSDETLYSVMKVFLIIVLPISIIMTNQGFLFIQQKYKTMLLLNFSYALISIAGIWYYTNGAEKAVINVGIFWLVSSSIFALIFTSYSYYELKQQGANVIKINS